MVLDNKKTMGVMLQGQGGGVMHGHTGSRGRFIFWGSKSRLSGGGVGGREAESECRNTWLLLSLLQ